MCSVGTTVYICECLGGLDQNKGCVTHRKMQTVENSSVSMVNIGPPPGWWMVKDPVETHPSVNTIPSPNWLGELQAAQISKGHILPGKQEVLFFGGLHYGPEETRVKWGCQLWIVKSLEIWGAGADFWWPLGGGEARTFREVA